MSLSRFACLCIAMLLPALGSAAEMRRVEVDYSDGQYTMESEVWFDAGQEAVYDVFLDWDLSPEFSSWIDEARNLEPDESGLSGYYIRNRGCILIMCKSVVREGRVEVERYLMIHAVANPDKSDFELSDETWTFRTEGDQTVVTYRIEMVPKFWVPPLVGPWAIKRKLRSSGGDALNRIEEIARAREMVGE